MSKSILYEERDNVGIITLNREKVLNAWNKEMRIKICKIFNKIKKEKKNTSGDINWRWKKSILCRTRFK